jgi:hypothetical protein
MKTLYTFFFLALIGLSAEAQTSWASDLSSWSNGNPTDWMNSARTSILSSNVTKDSTNIQAGTYAAKLSNTTSSSKRFASDSFNIVKGDIMSIKIWARGTGELGVRIWESSYVGSISYKTLDSTSWGEYSYGWVADTTISNAELLVYVKNTDSLKGDIIIDSVWVGLGTSSNKSIYDIQYTTLSSGISPLDGQLVTTKGLVTAVGGNGYFMQDGDSAWSGIWVFDPTNTPLQGDSISITGVVKEYFGITEIEAPSGYSVLSSGNPSPTPVSINSGDAEEKYESVLVSVTANCVADTATDNSGINWKVDDGSGQLYVQDLFYLYPNVTVNQEYEVVGPLNYAWSEWRICPRATSDVIAGLRDIYASAANFDVYPNPTSNEVNISNLSNNATVSILDLEGQLVNQYQTNSTLLRINTSDLNSGVYFLNIISDGITATKRLVIK